MIFCCFANNKLAKVWIRVLTEDPDARAKFQTIVGLLRGKYGAPTAECEDYTTPYYDGDGFEDQAIKVGKADFSAMWGTQLLVQISRSLTVDISYESEAWQAESNRRQGGNL